ncbi:MAG: hypothetical protein M0P49_03395 [Bacilli bacterium]|nr:hypothetical protein [Bacilli bacterium]
MKRVDRIMKKNRIRLTRFYRRNAYQIISNVINALYIAEDRSIIGDISIYHTGDIDDRFAKMRYDSMQELLGCTRGIDIHIFIDRVITEAALTIKFQKNRRHNLKRIFVSGLALVLYHEFYHIKRYDELSEDKFLELVERSENFEPDAYEEEYVDNKAQELVDRYIKYIFHILKI